MCRCGQDSSGSGKGGKNREAVDLPKRILVIGVGYNLSSWPAVVKPNYVACFRAL